MYEREVNGKVESIDQIEPEVLANFTGQRCNVISRTLLPWSEHCTECAAPTCYTTCDLYEARTDGKCRRFVNGMIRIPFPQGINSYLLKISFKKWAKLWTAANIHLFPPESARTIEIRDQRIGNVLRLLPVPSSIKKYLTGHRYDQKKQWAKSLIPPETLPDYFLVECFNPYEFSVNMTLSTLCSMKSSRMPFRTLVEMKPGFNGVRIPLHEIMSAFDLRSPFDMELVPNEIEEGITMFFGVMDFVKESIREVPVNGHEPADKATIFKCVVWDLDHTLWEGILVEDGPEKLRLKDGISDVLRDLDNRGILLSVASKNNRDEALAVLKKFDLDQYFLYPQISWGPKSGGVKAIAKHLNIGMDTIAFVDDSEFELAEVQASCPDIHLLKAADYLLLPEMKECQVPITDESRSRRKMYQADAVRQTAAAEFGGDYLAFLRNSQMKMKIDPLMPANIDRVHELTQRTNQMNFSGNRYQRATLQQILEKTHFETYVLSCNDHFGDYGIVGFSIVDKREPRMVDLMFSCRVQSKRVEHAFLSFVLKRYRQETNGDFWVNYHKTPKNEPAGRVFEDMGLETENEREGTLSLVFHRDREIPDDGIVEVVAADAADQEKALV